MIDVAIATMAYSRMSRCYQFPEGAKRANRRRSNGTFQAGNSPEVQIPLENGTKLLNFEFSYAGNLHQ